MELHTMMGKSMSQSLSRRISYRTKSELTAAVVALYGVTLGRIMRVEQGQVPEVILGPSDGLQLLTSVAFG